MTDRDFDVLLCLAAGAVALGIWCLMGWFVCSHPGMCVH